MKKIIAITTLLILSFGSYAQIDSATLSHKNSIISVVVPVKAVVLYANYMSETPTWEDRKAPDYFLTIIGSGTKPDSLVNVSLKADQLAVFAIRLTAERYGAISAPARSIFNNSPTITGYTALFTQVTNKANGNTSEKGAAQYVIARYNIYTQVMTDLYNDMYQKGLDWIRN